MFSLFTPSSPPNYNSYKSSGYSLPGWNNKLDASPTYGPPDPPTPPSVSTPKLNLSVTLSIPDVVRDNEVAKLLKAAYNTRPKVGPELRN